MNQPFKDEILELADGRLLGFSEFGNPGGRPVIYCHGFPASRLEARLLDVAAQVQGLRIIAPDRPGIGQSSFQPGRTLADCAADVRELARHLVIKRFAVLGVSGGGPYALACGAGLSASEVAGIAIVCPLGPLAGQPALRRTMHWPARLSFGLLQKMPRLGWILFAGPITSLLRPFPQQVLKLLNVSAPPSDLKVLANAEVKTILTVSYSEAMVQGGKGVAHDLLLYSLPWKIDFSDIRCPVQIWHGEDDQTVPIAMARFLAEKIQDCDKHFLQAEGHFSLPVIHAGSILRALDSHTRW